MGKLNVIKNEATKLVKEAISSMLGDDADVKVYVATNDTDWLDEEIEKCWSIQELLNDEMREVSDEEIIRKEEKAKTKKLTEVINELAKDMNKHFEKARDDVEKKQKQMLVDSPVKVEKKETCDCGENCKCHSKSKIVVENAFDAETLVKRKYINVNNTVSKILTSIFDYIKKSSEEGKTHLCYYVIKGHEEELRGVIQPTLDKVFQRTFDYLEDKGFRLEVVDYETGLLSIGW